MRKHFTLFLLFLGLTLTSGCRKNPFEEPWEYAPKSSGKVWRPDKQDLKKVYTIELNDTISLPDPEEVTSLGELFDIGLSNSPKTQKTWEEARMAAAEYSSSLSTYLPFISFDGYFLSSKSGVVLGNQYSQSKTTHWGPEIELQYLLFDAGNRAAKVESYYQTLQSLNWTHNEEIQGVMQTIALSYYDHLYAKALKESYEKDLENAKRTYQAAEKKSLSGIFDTTTMMQAKTSYLKQKVLLTAQDAAVKNTLVDLLDVIGVPCTIDVNFGGFPDHPPFTLCDNEIDSLIETAKKCRPEYQSAKASILMQEANIKEAKTELFPKLNLAAEGGEQWYSNGKQDKGNYSVRFDLTFPIFSGFYYRNQIRKEEALLGKASAQLRNIELSMIREVKTAHNNLTMTQRQLVDTKEYLQASEIEYAAMFEKFQNSIVDILDLLNSQASLFDARSQFISAQRDYFMAVINLAYALGTLTNSCPWNLEEN